MKSKQPLALITGAARRIGAVVAQYLHQKGYRVIIHCHHSQSEAEALVAKLNLIRPESARVMGFDLADSGAFSDHLRTVVGEGQPLDLLVNNASSFFPTPLGKITEHDWDNLFNSNCKGPLFLSQAAAPALALAQGQIINVVDIHAEKPLKGYPVYCIAKAGLLMMTYALAKELSPSIRVNAVAPGPILWPEGENRLDQEQQQDLIKRTLLKRRGEPLDVAKAIYFLAHEADYLTGEVIHIDGGRRLVGS